jgi:hypothetical protein
MPLEAPSQAVPSGVAVTASSVSSPNSVPNAPTTTASSVTSPNASVSSPNTVSSVTSPSSSNTPVSSVSSVTPPVSSVKPVGTSTVKPLDFRWTPEGDCIKSWVFGVSDGGFGVKDDPDCVAWDLAKAAENNERKTNEILDSNASAAEKAAALENLARRNAALQDRKYGQNAVTELEGLFDGSYYKKLSPEGKMVLLRVLNSGMSLGTIGAADLKDLRNSIRVTDNGYPAIPSGLGKPPSFLQSVDPNSSSVLLRGGASVALGFVPIVGDALAVTGAILGRDPITGEELTGVWRWLGLLGLIGLGEAAIAGRAARGVEEAAQIVNNVQRASRRGVRIAESCATNSFTEETLVATPTGNKPISKLKVGDKVLAYNESRDQEGTFTIQEVFNSTKSSSIEVKLRTDTNQLETIIATPEHPFWVNKKAEPISRPKPSGYGHLSDYWVGAKDLKIGDTITRVGGLNGRVESVKAFEKSQRFYNLSVQDAETFFVGEGNWLAHNCFKAVINGVEVAASRQAGLLAAIADVVFMEAVPVWARRFTTVAVTQVGDRFIVNVNGLSAGLQQTIQNNISGLRHGNLDFIFNNTKNHAEIFSYGSTNSQIIGVSHQTGPCPNCQNFFQDLGVEIGFSGWRK